MYGFWIGALGVVFTVVVLVGGALIGWYSRISYDKKEKAAVGRERTEQEKKRAAEEAEAFDILVNYSPEVAYGLTKAGRRVEEE